MNFRPDLTTCVAATSTVVMLAFNLTTQVGDGVFHPSVFVLALAVVSGFLLTGLVLWGALKLLVGRRGEWVVHHSVGVAFAVLYLVTLSMWHLIDTLKVALDRRRSRRPTSLSAAGGRRRR